MIKLQTLTFKNIGRFVEEQKIDFTNKPKLIQLDGYNENTGGSSGAGKSTVFQVLGLLLGFNDLPASSLQSRLTKDGFYVVGTFLIDNQAVIIERSKKDGLKITIDGVIFEGSSKICEEKLDNLIKIPRNLFQKMVYKPQKEGGFFLNLTAKESYKFLIECLNLNVWEEKAEKITQNIKKLEDSSLVLSTKIEQDEVQIKNLESSLCNILPPTEVNVGELLQEKDVLVEQIDKLKEKIQQFRDLESNEIKELTASFHQNKPIQPILNQNEQLLQLKQELESVNRDEQGVLPLFLSGINEIKSTHRNLCNIINHVESEIDKLSSLKEELLNFKNQQEHMIQSKCPTCSQQWLGASLSEKAKDVASKILSHKDKIDVITDKQANLPRLQGLRDKAEQEVIVKEEEYQKAKELYLTKKTSIKSKIDNIEKENYLILQEFNNKLKEYELKYGESKFNIEQKYLKMAENDIVLRQNNQKRVDFITNTINLHSKSVENYENLTKNTKNSIETLTKSLKNDKKELKKQQKEIEIATESRRAIKSYTLQIFQDSLNFISSYATKLLNAVPSMVNATIYFENTKETKSGKIKDEINCIINIDGEDGINIKTLSGGERTAVDLAVDLAVVEMLETQLGIGADWVVLDEPMTGLDIIGIEAIVEVIKQSNLSKRIILVDHHSETKELVDETIKVIRTGLTSHIFDGI